MIELADKIVRLAMKVDVEVRVAHAEGAEVIPATRLRLLELRQAVEQLTEEVG
jgi:thymidine phosphorylase